MDQLPANYTEERILSVSPELVDMIIDQLAGDDSSLRRCSLVARQWVPRCRYHLLRVVSFMDSHPGQSLAHWCATFGATDANASLVRELRFRQVGRIWIYPKGFSRYIPHLSHFTNVTSLILSNFVTGVFSTASLSHCFQPFFSRVRNLRFHRPITRPGPLMQVILLFSSAINIQISWPRWSIADERIDLFPPLLEGSGLTGTLYLRGLGRKWHEFFTLLSARRLAFHEIRLQACEFNSLVPTQSLLEAVSQSARTLRLSECGKQRLYSGITLQTFNVLERLEFRMTENGIGGDRLAGLLDSISSLTFSLLALDVSSRERWLRSRGIASKERFFGEMRALDRPLHKLANRGLQGTGERFTLIVLANDPSAVAQSFVEFRKVGNIWKGAKVIRSEGHNFYWTSAAATNSEDKTVGESVLSFVNV